MKILCLVPDIAGYRGGIQRYLFDLVEVLTEHHSVTYISKCSSHKDVHHSHSERLRGIHLGWSGGFQNVILVLTFLLQVIFRRPDLVIVGHIHYAPLVSRICGFFRVPYIVCTYGVESWSYLGASYKKALHATRKIISISTFTINKLQEVYDIPQSMIARIPCTSLPEIFHPRQASRQQIRSKYGITENSTVLLTVGRMDVRESFHSYDNVVKIFPQLCEHLGEVHYLLVGDGTDVERVKQQTDGIPGIHLTGFVSDDDLASYYAAADLFVAPGKLEGFGIVFLEALLSGLPVITGSTDGSAEILEAVPFGCAVDADDSEQLRRAIISLLEQRQEGKYDKERVRERALEKFGPQVFKSQLYSLLHDL